ncbi:ATP-binding cassette domain-containing protein [Mycolicibacter arupensis]|jgi:ABC-type multidrug transport system ATPase subunit|uniref:ABC transporter ATP-binding protein n=1 Tax=Mycolicibacter arupensis TaxID=342002 RepID=A0A0F5MWC4_9MYCO|nr:ATP-binding cassette domain-containing protein [Mycolicibacter arupensis]KKB98991.1 ABC transporter ATP-binding protein [Mycolicibacter arupensis]MCV7276011.1 ATP-binding cassette domain-containing protein [Mycolicibacter arupensis]OQZ92762.1 ABC transporter ATP-binding protein [Mycolicibacter arupensis]
MSHPAPPVLTVRYDGSQGTFSAGHDVVIGRDLRADVRIPHPLVSRAHLLLRFEQGRWLGVDNGSLNGIYVNGQRVPVVEIRDGQAVSLGNPDGPRVSFEVGRHQGQAGRPPQTVSIQVPQPGIARPSLPPQSQGWPSPPVQQPYRPPTGPAPYPPPPPAAPRPPAYPAGPSGPLREPALRPHYQPAPAEGVFQPQQSATRMAPVSATPPEAGSIATRMIDILRPSSASAPNAPAGALTIGRAIDNDVVISDVLASRHHAMLVPTPLGTEIRDSRSINGTFVNGVRIGSAILSEGDVVTIGNVDLEFHGGTLVRRTDTTPGSGGLEVRDVCFDVEGGKRLLNNISLNARPGTLTAIIGGSGAGKTTLARLIAGYTSPTSGTTLFEGHNIHADYASLRSRIGMVPQDDVVHRQLTVNQALGYAAELRLPPDSSQADRDQAVARVLEELEMTKHADTRVDKLSGGQRKRASVALELLTGPSLLLLDEPTSGLDPALDRQVMLMLRGLADAGRVVMVVTHSVAYLDVCDQILLLAPGGKIAYCGPPKEVFPAMGADNWADIFANVGADPDEANRRFLERDGGQRSSAAVAETPPADLGKPAATSLVKQLSTIARRQIRLIVSDRGYSIFLALLPFIVGILSLTVEGSHGLGIPGPDAPTEPRYIMVLLNIGAVFMGTALTIRDLIGERPIFRREQAVGLSTVAYLLAKIAVFCVFATIQAAIATTIVVLGKGGPARDAVLFGSVNFELFLGVAGTCVASAILGLALSAFAQSNEQIMPMLVVSIMSQLVLSSGMIPVGGRTGLDQLSWLTPARWGYAAGGSTVDFNTLMNAPQIPKDRLWDHTRGIWLLDMGMLALLSVCYSLLVWWKIRLKR